jgi:prepilin-type N-terminal cleavage/methylation domain-containing protein
MYSRFKKTSSFCHSCEGRNPVLKSGLGSPRLREDDKRMENDKNMGLPGSAFRSRKTTTGFSLIELMVVIAIFAIISGVIMFNYGRFSSNMIVTNLAYEAALAVRQAQVYGISVKKTTEGAKFDASYGVWFSESDKQNFYLFSDKDGDKMYTEPAVGNPNLELEESFGFNGSNIIKNFCVTDSGGTRTCSSVSSELQYLSIVFTRPDPEAKIYAFNSGKGQIGATYSKAEIMFTMARGDKIARMTVTNTGQMSIDSCNSVGKTCPE